MKVTAQNVKVNVNCINKMYKTVQSSTVQYNAVQYSAGQYNTIQKIYITKYCIAIDAFHFHTIGLCTVLHCTSK